MSIFITSLIAAAGIIIILSKMLSFTRVVKYQLWIDICATVGAPILFFGTFSGMATAFLTGLIISVTLWFSKLFV